VFCNGQNAPNSFCRRGSAPDSNAGAHDAPPDFQSAREGDTLSPFPTPSTPAAPHLELGGNLLQGLRGIDTPE